LYIKFEDDSDSTVIAWNNEQLQEFEFNLDQKIKYVLVDPYRWVLRQESYNPELPVGLSENINSKNVSVFPNPVSNQLSIKIEETGKLPLKFELFDFTGRLSFTAEIDLVNTTLNLSKLQKGLYFYRFLDELNRPVQYGKTIKN